MKVVSAANAPAAIGPYSQALDLGNMVFVSGQLPVDPATGTMADTVEQQAAQSLANLKAILAEAGLSMNNVVKTVIFLADINDFAAVNAEYAKAFACLLYTSQHHHYAQGQRRRPGGKRCGQLCFQCGQLLLAARQPYSLLRLCFFAVAARVKTAGSGLFVLRKIKMCIRDRPLPPP